MVRAVDSLYQFWLAGYYDDFTGARAIADDGNSPSLTATYSHVTSHHGNPMNGEATLNPRFRWSYNERAAVTSRLLTTSTTKFIANLAEYKWLRHDDIRNGHTGWEGMSQLQYPDGIANPNRMRFDDTDSIGENVGGFQRFVNGFRTAADYIVPNGDQDSTHGRVLKYSFSENNHNANYSGAITYSGSNEERVDYQQFANLTGCWMGERLEARSLGAPTFHDVAGGVDESPNAVWVPVKSPAGKPFLQITSYHGDSNNNTTHNNSHEAHINNSGGTHKRPAIAYNGTLNSRDDGDIFTVRFAVRGFNGHVSSSGGSTSGRAPIVSLYVGYSDTLSATDELGYSSNTNTAAIEWTMDFADNEGLKSGLNYDFLRQLYTEAGGTTKQTYDNDDLWIDMDFVLDYTNNRYRVFCNGTQVTGTNALGGSESSGYYTLKNNNVTSANFTPTQMKGWMATVEPQSSSNNENCTIVLMLDRVGLVRPLTDSPEQKGDGWDMPPIRSMKMVSPVDGISNLQIEVSDDPGRDGDNIGSLDTHYGHQLTKLFSTSSNDDWSLLMFADDEGNKHTAREGGGRIDRPVWRGILDKMSVNDSGPKQRTIQLTAKDTLHALDRQVPLWELGQGSLNDENSAKAYWTDSAKGWNDVFYMGAARMKMLSKTVGFDKDDNYVERTDQRTQLHSSHPIQIYNNESNSGPNSIEEQYEGNTLLGVGIDTSGHTMLLLAGNPGYTTSSDVIVSNTANHNLVATQQPSAVGTYTNPSILPTVPTTTHQFLKFDGTSGSVLAYTRESALIVYAGGYHGDRFTDGSNSPLSASAMYFHFDSDPQLEQGDRFLIPDGGALDNSRPTGLGDGAVGGIYTCRFKSTYTRNNVTYHRVAVFDDEKFSTHSEGHATTGQYNTTDASGYLSGNARIRFTKLGKESGVVRPITNNLIESKAVHAVWVRDLPKSLWFQYHFGQIANAPDATGTIQAATTTDSKYIQIDATAYNAIDTTGGLGEIVDADGTVDTFVWKAKATGGGNYYLIGVQFLSKAHDNGATVNVLTVSDDYKHCWVLWADMRNNGKADADNSQRKDRFGLMFPTSENYEVSLFYDDQFDAMTGEPDRFASLKLGEDCDLWEISSLTDPTTGGAFSKPANYADLQTLTSITDNGSGKARLTVASNHYIFGPSGSLDYYVHVVGSALHDGVHKVSAVGSTTIDLDLDFAGTDNAPAWGYKWGRAIGSETEHRPGGASGSAEPTSPSSNSVYQDWENKGGAFVVVDASKFFNLNTLANNGKSGQDSGGRTDLEDYFASVRGFPKLIDSYWSEAMANFKTVTVPYSQHPNTMWCMSDGTTATNTILQGDTAILVKDASNFPYRGWGEMVATSSGGGSGTTSSTSSSQTTKVSKWFHWSGCVANEITGTMTSGTNTVAGSGATETRTLVDSSGDFINKGIIVGMVVQNNNTNQAAIVREVTSATTLKVFTSEATSAFSSGHTYKFAPQLAGINHVPSGWEQTIVNAGYSSQQILDHLNTQMALRMLVNNAGAPTTFTLNTTNSTSGGYDKVEIFNTIASKFMLRLMMTIEGYVESRGLGTYFESDKMRTLWTAGTLDSWMPRTNFSCIFDINNVPLTMDMTTDGTASNSDSFGSVSDLRGKTVLGSVRTIKESIKAGVDNDTAKSFSYLMGRDGRIELRPNYNSGWAINRDNSLSTKLDADIGAQISHVRVYYNAGRSFADFPVASTTDTTKWKVLDMPSLTSQIEAEAVAKNEYNRVKDSKLKVEVEIMRDTSTLEHNKMLTGARYGYIADTTRMVESDATNSNSSAPKYNSWDSLQTGGMPFPGMCNALDGNMATATDIYNRYGQSAQIDTTATAGHSVDWNENWYWYGANSISYAVQIVNVSNGVPKVSATTGEELRVWVALKNGQSGTDIDNAEFLIGISDCSFSGSTTAKGGGGPSLAASLATNGFESVVAKGSGFYEIEVPTSYYNVSPQAKIVVSFNAEYCKALLRHRCGDPTASGILHNAHNISEMMGSNWSATSANSIFPIGMRKYAEMSSAAHGRAAWYAPRIHIVNDLNFIPATTVTYTNKSHDLNSEVLAIQRVNWQIDGRNTERVTLSLERDESRFAGGLGAYLFPVLGDTSRANAPGPPPAPPQPAPDRPPQDGRPQGPSQPDQRPQHPQGGQFPGFGDQTGSHTNIQWSVNNTTKGLHSNIKRRMDMDGATVGGWGILGQNRPAPPASAMSPVEGLNFDVVPESGMAVKTDDGFCLPGKGHPDETGYQEHSISTTLQVPSDAIGESISIFGTISCAPIDVDGSGKTGARQAVLIVEAQCTTDTAKTTVSQNVAIETGTTKSDMALLDQTLLSGISPGSEIKVTVKRKPGTTTTISNQLSRVDGTTTITSSTQADNANEDGVVVHDLSIRFNRASVNVDQTSSRNFGFHDWKNHDNS